MATRVIRRMSLARASIVVFVAVALLTSLLMIKMTQGGEALPLGPTDQAAVPHYFGPWPNWVLSPLTLPDVQVDIVDPGGVGTGATATATVGGNGAVTGITITNPGSGYTAATRQHHRAPARTPRPPPAVTTAGAVVAVNVTRRRRRATHQPTVTLIGRRRHHGRDRDRLRQRRRRPTADASAAATPSRPSTSTCRTTRTARRPRRTSTFDAITGEITDIIVDNPGSGYLDRAGVVIRDGTLYRPHHQRRHRRHGDDHADGLERDARHLRRRLHLRPDGDHHRRHRRAAAGAVAARRAWTAAPSPPITVTAPGTGYVTAGGISKFQDDSARALRSGRRRQLPRLADQPRREVHPARRAGGEVLPESHGPGDHRRRVRDRRGPVPRPSSSPTCRRRSCAATCSSRRRRTRPSASTSR